MNRLIISLLLLLLLAQCRQGTETAANSGESDSMWQHRGDSLISRTFDTLRQSLLQAIAEKGYPGAIGFCQTAALPLTGSFAGAGTAVKRTSSWLRNPANAPDSLEALVLEQFGKQFSSGQKAAPLLQQDASGNRHYFKPIMLQAMCLACHGSLNKDISPATASALREKYPSDQAVNFKEGAWRGIWHITFYQPHSARP